MTRPAPPVPPISVEIRIGADDVGYVRRRLAELLERIEERDDPSRWNGFGGGGGGSYSMTVTMRDVSVEDYRAELHSWWESSRVSEPAEPARGGA